MSAPARSATTAIDGSSGGLYSKTIARSYQDGNGVPGRYAGVAISADSYNVTYGYDAYGRSGSMTAGADTFTYAYLANSDLLAAIAYPHGIASTRTYDDIQLRPPATPADYVGQDGNITAYVDSSDDVVYSADYSPFGEAFSESGTAPCAFGFSTIYRDEETGFLIYRFRPYDPARGVWPTKDPIGELGGINLYGFVGNDAVNGTDLFGMKFSFPYFWQVMRVSNKEIMENAISALYTATLGSLNAAYEVADLGVDAYKQTFTSSYDDIESIARAKFAQGETMFECPCDEPGKSQLANAMNPGTTKITHQVLHCIVGHLMREAGISRSGMNLANIGYEAMTAHDEIPGSAQAKIAHPDRNWVDYFVDVVSDMRSVQKGYSDQNLKSCIPNKCKLKSGTWDDWEKHVMPGRRSP